MAVGILFLLFGSSYAQALSDSDDADTVINTDLAVMSDPQAAAAILVEANSGQILFASNADEALPPASTTKILTALLALDMQADLDKPREISSAAAAVEEMSLNLKAGEQLSLGDLLRGALVHSGNDACYAVGEIVAGGEDLFVHWMNMKAAVLGAYSVHMENTNGLPAANHTLSATDLARITIYALQNDFFAETVKSKYVAIGESESYRYYKNTNKLLWQDEQVVGVKTGTTDAAGHCLVSAYEDGAALLVAVVLNSPDRYNESWALLQYGAEDYMLLDWPCSGDIVAYYLDGKKGVLLRAAKDLHAVIDEDQLAELKLSWELSATGGSLSLKDAQGKILAATPLIVVEDDD